MSFFDVQRNPIPDDQLIPKSRRDMSAGANTRMDALMLGENQAVELFNIDITVPGKRVRRRGSLVIAQEAGATEVCELFSFKIQGDTDQLLKVAGVDLKSSSNLTSWSTLYSSVSGTDVSIVQGKQSGLSPDDVCILQDGTSNARLIKTDGTITDLGNTNTSPPITTVGAWHQNRFWYLKNDLGYYSDAYDSDYSTAFDRTTNAFRIPVGEERMVVSTRDLGIIFGGSEQIWALFPSPVPAATDQPQPLLTNYGLVSKKGYCEGGDDIYFFSNDGLRALKRTIQDKLQVGVSYPLSYGLKDDFDDINWGRIDELSMTHFDNKVICSIPTGASDFMQWIYYTALGSCVRWGGEINARCFAKHVVDGEERLYYGHYSNSDVYRYLYGFTDEGTSTTNGTAIVMREVSRKEDMGMPLVMKDGGELEIRATKVGDYDLTVYAQFDDAGWYELGTINLEITGVTFPTTFPVTFVDAGVAREKFHLRRFGKWRHMQYKIQITTSTSSDDIEVIESNITSYVDEYQEE